MVDMDEEGGGVGWRREGKGTSEDSLHKKISAAWAFLKQFAVSCRLPQRLPETCRCRGNLLPYDH